MVHPVYLHCDWHASHYLKVMCDGIFGYKNFRNEIIWCYAGGGVPKKDLPRKHDTILRYVKTDKYTYNPIYRPYTEGTIERGRIKSISLKLYILARDGVVISESSFLRSV